MDANAFSLFVVVLLIVGGLLLPYRAPRPTPTACDLARRQAEIDQPSHLEHL